MSEPTSNERLRIIKPLAAVLLCVRFAIGWHFFYEGLAKLLSPGWTSAPYLIYSRGIFAPFFHWLASTPALLRTIDLLNMWGLTLIGLALMLGCFSRLASASGITLLAMYYLAHPPFIQTDFRVPLEGHYLLIDKNVVELVILIAFVVLPSDALWGIGRLVRRLRQARTLKTDSGKSPEGTAEFLSRRKTLEDLAMVPMMGVFGLTARKKYKYEKMHAITGATIKLQEMSLKDLKGVPPQGKLGKFQVSRLILGGNLIGGFSHSRDLIYVSSLSKAYNTEKKVFETLDLAERAGINTFLADASQLPLFSKYREWNSSKMLTICQVFPKPEDLTTNIDKAIDDGADILYVQGAHAERFVKAGQIDLLGKVLDHIKSQGHLAGVGGHSIQVPIQCEKAGLELDFYVKTLHHDHYWSAHPRENRVEFSVDTRAMDDHNQFHDNIFDLFPEQTIEFMQGVKKPWIAFKVLAGGAIKPRDGFRFAFENGADFICVGMFDFQIVADVNTVLEVLAGVKERKRPWLA